MADDIVTRLQCIYDHDGCNQCTFCLAKAEIERLRAAGDELVASLTPVSFAGPHEDMNRLERAYLAWQEAHRG